MSYLFEESGDMKDNLFEYLSDMFDPAKNAERVRLSEIEAEIKQIQNEN